MGTGLRQRYILQSQASLGGNVPGGNNRGGTFRGEFSGGEFAGHHKLCSKKQRFFSPRITAVGTGKQKPR